MSINDDRLNVNKIDGMKLLKYMKTNYKKESEYKIDSESKY